MVDIWGRTSMNEWHKTARFFCKLELWRMGMLWMLCLISCYFRLFVRSLSGQRNSDSFPRSKPASMSTTGSKRPVCIVTGGYLEKNSRRQGLKETEGHILHNIQTAYFHDSIVGRSVHLLSKTVSDIRKQNEDAHLKAFEVDLSSFSSIMEFRFSLEQWLKKNDLHFSIQLLINNAGILAISSKRTADGLDEMMATNYVGAFCLTKLLLPLLTSSPVPSRIVNVTSFTHRNVNDVQVGKEFVAGKPFSKLVHYPFAHVYEYSKFCLVLFTYKLHQQFSLMEDPCQLSVVAADPGVVKTNLMRELPPCLSFLACLGLSLLGLLQCPDDGAQSILDAALAPIGTSGVYFFGGKGRTLGSSILSRNPTLVENLWESSCDLFMDLKIASTKPSTST